MGWVRIVMLGIAATVALPALCQDLPARTGRLAHSEGAVSIQLAFDSPWGAAAVNMPLTSGNSVSTEPGSRAEIRVSATAIRLAEGSELEIRRLDDDGFEANVASGSASVHVRFAQRGERFAFSTPQAVFVLDAEGVYRIDYDPVVDESRLTVASGSAHIDGPGRVVIPAGRSLRLAGGTEPSYGLEAAPEEDDFDHWARSRDSGWSDASARRYVSPYMTGYEDLDANGQWSSDPDYGPVWTPSRVDPSWSPYSDGRWANVQPWGWTWIDNAPWERLQPWYRATPAHVDRVNAIVRDRPPPREWKGPPDGWRNWNRDHATRAVNRETFPPRPVSPPAPQPGTTSNAEALRHTRESAQHQKAPLPPKPPAPPPRPAEKEKQEKEK